MCRSMVPYNVEPSQYTISLCSKQLVIQHTPRKKIFQVVVATVHDFLIGSQVSIHALEYYVYVQKKKKKKRRIWNGCMESLPENRYVHFNTQRTKISPSRLNCGGNQLRSKLKLRTWFWVSWTSNLWYIENGPTYPKTRCKWHTRRSNDETNTSNWFYNLALHIVAFLQS